MGKARPIINKVLSLNDERFEAHIRVFEVPTCQKFPMGYKVSCSLIEKGTGVLLVLLDNHEPYGYHLHTKLPEDKHFRSSVNVKNYNEAIDLFFAEVTKIQIKKVQNEK
ncbi:MAG: hypothetical protein V4654_04425 [Bdellovibrionota bacterium]